LITTHIALNPNTRLISKHVSKKIITSLVSGTVIATIFYSVKFFVDIKPYEVIFGYESQDSFLVRNVNDYRAQRFINSNIPESNSVMLMWDGQSYYCENHCWPDTDQSNWTRLVLKNINLYTVVNELQNKGITHLLFSKDNVSFILKHDPTENHQKALEYFLYKFVPLCTKKIYSDEWSDIYELRCSTRHN
jgi:hypothetical protein